MKIEDIRRERVEQTVGLSRLLDQYVACTANTWAPDLMRAKALMVEMMTRCARAHQLLVAEERAREGVDV
jgi:hypothetical protein